MTAEFGPRLPRMNALNSVQEISSQFGMIHAGSTGRVSLFEVRQVSTESLSPESTLEIFSKYKLHTTWMLQVRMNHPYRYPQLVKCSEFTLPWSMRSDEISVKFVCFEHAPRLISPEIQELSQVLKFFRSRSHTHCLASNFHVSRRPDTLIF